MEFSDFWKMIAAGLAAVVGAGFALKFVIQKKTSQNSKINMVSQKNNKAGGDIVGGNSTKITKK